jgi:hypothetical protein
MPAGGEPEAAATPAREPEAAATPAGEGPPARDGGAETAGEPVAGSSPGAPVERTDQYADATPAAGAAGPYGGRTHTIRRRRGGLLSALFSRR